MSHAKKILFALICIAVFSVLLALSVLAVPPLPDMSGAKSVYLYNVEQKTVMAEKDATLPVYPTSTTKIMTGLVAIDALSGRLTEKVTVTENMLKGVSGNNIKLKAGEKVSIADMLYATLCGGANDAAAVLAFTVAGSIEDFTALMNKKAEELGALDTHYTNVSGLHDPAMLTTAYDTFLIAKAASENSLFVQITSESRYQMPETNMSDARNVYNKNFLISRYSETKYYNRYAKGLNSGSTSQGGYCLATCTEKDGQTYICVVMGAEERGEDVHYEHRCALRAVLNVCGRDLLLVVCHMGLARSEAENAVQTVCRILDECDLPAIVMGDFNHTLPEGILAPLLERLSDTDETSEQRGTFTFPSYGPKVKIDYIFCRKLRCKNAYVIEDIVSDHFPVVADLEFE